MRKVAHCLCTSFHLFVFYRLGDISQWDANRSLYKVSVWVWVRVSVKVCVWSEERQGKVRAECMQNTLSLHKNVLRAKKVFVSSLAGCVCSRISQINDPEIF